jgi:hypothetical protein
LRKSSAEARLRHGDIISFAAPPQHGNIQPFEPPKGFFTDEV